MTQRPSAPRSSSAADPHLTPFERMLAELNPEQREAATYTGDQLVILAGAGTGKTKTLVARVAVLLERGIPPERILLLTFTRRAAAQMLRRAAAVCGNRRARQVRGGTFHAVGQGVLRAFAKRAGLDPNFTILDRGDAEDMIDLARESLGLRSGSGAAAKRRFPGKGTILSCYSRCVSTERPLEEVLHEHFPWIAPFEQELRQIFRVYEERKQAQEVLDFDDLLSYWRAVLQDPVLGPEARGDFDHVLVDEYQDTNRVQREIVLGLGAGGLGAGGLGAGGLGAGGLGAGAGGLGAGGADAAASLPPRSERRSGAAQVTVVGDDAQAIYSFRGATVENIRAFPQDFPRCEVLRLERNYRSTEPILAVANAAIALATELPDAFRKQLFSGRESERRPIFARVADEDEQAAYVADRVLERREEGVPLRQQAVLFRTAHHSDLLELELARRHIPFHKFGGLRLTDAAHVKDVISFLRVVENPADASAWFRLLKLLEGVGPKSAGAVVEHLQAQGNRLEALSSVSVPPAARQPIDALRELLFAIARDETTSESFERLSAFYEPILRLRYERADARLEDLATLAHVARGCESRRAFLAELSLNPPDGSGDHAGPPHLDDDWLVLSTIHSAKGLEWEAVTLLNASDGMIPSDLATGRPEEVEEERRLLYVALTRAKRHLEVVYPQRYHKKEHRYADRHLYPKVTRFLPPEVLSLFEEVVREPPAQARDAAERAGSPVADLRSQARARW